MGIETIIGGGLGLLGAGMQADAASDAAAGQERATREANALKEKMFNKTVELNQPAVDAGNLARNKLLYLMGLSPTGTSAPAQSVNRLTREQIASELMNSGNYKTQAGSPVWVDGLNFGNGGWQAQEGIDQARLDADVNARLAQQEQAAAQPVAQTPVGSDYGSLLKSFGIEDFQADPGYQFRLSEGEKGINRAMASRGQYDSGAALKALQRYGQDYASGEFGNAYNRYTANQTSQYNRLAGLAGSGQTAANTLGNAGADYANYAGNNLTSNANAQGAAGIAGANAWSNALTSGFNNYQQQNFANSLLKNLNGTGYGGGLPSNRALESYWS